MKGFCVNEVVAAKALFSSAIDLGDIQALAWQWNPCRVNTMKPTAECTPNKEEKEEKAGGGRYVF